MSAACAGLAHLSEALGRAGGSALLASLAGTLTDIMTGERQPGPAPAALLRGACLARPTAPPARVRSLV